MTGPCPFYLEVHMSGHDEHGHEEEKLVKVTLYLEEDHVEALDKAARQYSRMLGTRWSRGAVVRLALSDFFSRKGVIT